LSGGTFVAGFQAGASGDGRAAANRKVAGEASPRSAAPTAIEEAVEGPPTSCEGFPGEDPGGFLSTGLLSGGRRLRRRSVARSGGRRCPARSGSSAPGCLRPGQSRFGSQARPGPDTPADPTSYRTTSGGDHVAFSNHNAAATEHSATVTDPCCLDQPLASPCECCYTSASPLHHSLP
jgi:hypothetical protein